MPAPQTALKYEAAVADNGRIELNIPLPAGTPVVVFVVEQPRDEFTDLVSAAQSCLDFWDNPYDGEDWNNA